MISAHYSTKCQCRTQKRKFSGGRSGRSFGKFHCLSHHIAATVLLPRQERMVELPLRTKHCLLMLFFPAIQMKNCPVVYLNATHDINSCESCHCYARNTSTILTQSIFQAREHLKTSRVLASIRHERQIRYSCGFTASICLRNFTL